MFHRIANKCRQSFASVQFLNGHLGDYATIVQLCKLYLAQLSKCVIRFWNKHRIIKSAFLESRRANSHEWNQPRWVEYQKEWDKNRQKGEIKTDHSGIRTGYSEMTAKCANIGVPGSNTVRTCLHFSFLSVLGWLQSCEFIRLVSKKGGLYNSMFISKHLLFHCVITLYRVQTFLF